jgi:hypothetical protein
MSVAARPVTPYSMVFANTPSKDVAIKLERGIGEAKR